MEIFTNLVAAFANLSRDHVIALIALGAFGLSAWAIYVVFTVAKERKGR